MSQSPSPATGARMPPSLRTRHHQMTAARSRASSLTSTSTVSSVSTNLSVIGRRADGKYVNVHRLIEDTQKLIEGINISMWESRTQQVMGADMLWPEPFNKLQKAPRRIESAPPTRSSRTLADSDETKGTPEASNATADAPSEAAPAKKRVGIEMTMVDFYAIRQRGMRQLKPDRTYSAGETVYTNFCTFVDSAHIVDEFLLAFVLYFRFFFRVDRAERTSICIDIDPLQQAQRDADPFRGANSTVDIWTNTVLKHSGESAKRTENIRVFSRELGAALVILGTIYTRILKSVVKQRTRDSAREKLFFTYLSSYLNACLKPMFDTSFHEDMHRELERLMKTQWFASHNHQSIDELIGSGTRNKKPDDTSSRPKSPTAVRRPSTSIGVRTGTFTIAEEPTGNGNHAVDSSAKDADPIVINEETIRRRRLSMEQKQQHAIADPLAHHLSAEIRNSLAYKDLIRLRARQLDSPLIKAFRPQTAPPGVCPRRLLAVKPIPAQCGAIMINAKSKRSVMAKFSAAVQEEEMWRLTAKNARLADGKDINDMQPECHSMRLQRPHTAHPSSASTESTVCKPTIASSLRVEGVLAKKRRKVFATITHANNASLHTRMKLDYSDLEQSLVVTPFKAEYVAEWGECTQHTVNMAYFPFNDSPTMGELCLEACSPMVNAAIQTVPRIMVPEPSMRERRLSIAVVGTARRSSEGAANFIQSAKLTNTQLRDAWQRYERQVMAAKEERDPVDLIDKFQLRLNSFRW